MPFRNPYLSNSELTAFRRNRAFSTGNYDELLNVYNLLMEENLKSQSCNRVLLNLWSALSICEYASDKEQVLKTLEQALNFSPFLHQIDDYAILIESIVTKFIDSSSEITSTSYFILSVLFLNKRNYNRSYYYAKMAHFYALQLDLSNNQPYLCYAQLQLIFSQLLMDQVQRAEHYIEQFDWYLGNCKNEQEIKQTVQLLKNTIQGYEEEADLIHFAKKLADSNKSFYPLYLLMQMKHLVHKSSNPIIIQKVSEFYLSVQQQILTTSKEALNDYYLLRNRLITNSNLFFLRAEQLFEKIKNDGSEVQLLHLANVHLNLPSLYDFTLHAPEIDFLLYPIQQSEFLIVFDCRLLERLQYFIYEHIIDSKILIELYSTPNTARFINLYIEYAELLNELWED